jgi:hypothetical protein
LLCSDPVFVEGEVLGLEAPSSMYLRCRNALECRVTTEKSVAEGVCNLNPNNNTWPPREICARGVEVELDLCVGVSNGAEEEEFGHD